MSRVSKWKLEKNKVKVVFRLQFHATHVPHTGWDKLFISFISVDVGKTTAKTNKANVRNGTCRWADPIYETTRLLQDSKTKHYDEKLYRIVVAMGSSRASTLGETTINLADYVDALKPSAVSLPLQGCNFGTMLHMTIQLLTSKTGFREFEQQRELRERGIQTGVAIDGHSASSKISYSEEVNDQIEVSARVKHETNSNEHSAIEEDVNMNQDSAITAAFDGSSNVSGSLYRQKDEISSSHEIVSLQNTMSYGPDALSHCQTIFTEQRESSDHQHIAEGKSDLVRGRGSGNSIDNKLAMASDKTNLLRDSLELAESSFSDLKLEVGSLQRFADELGTETQNFSHILAAEISSAEKLTKEVSVMKSECLKFKEDIIRLKDLKVPPQLPVKETSDNRVDHSVIRVQHHLSKGISAAEGKIRELLNRTYAFADDKDSRLTRLELEALLNILQEAKHGNIKETSFFNKLPSEIKDVKEITEWDTVKPEQFVSGNEFGLDLCPPESIIQHFSVNAPVSDMVNTASAFDAMNGQLCDLVRELEEAKVEKEALTRKMDQMECYYESLIQELEENQKHSLGELEQLRNEHSACLYMSSTSRVEMETMREEMLRLADERHHLDALNKELEERATTSEAALRRARLNYSIAVDKLQRDLELLSTQVVSMFKTNENLIKAFIEPCEPQLLKDPEDGDAKSLQRFQNWNLGLRKRSMGGDILLEDLKKSFCMQEELYQKVEEELIEMYYINLNLDIYSKALQESLYEANSGLRIMREKMDELVEELDLSTASQNKLMARLQKATDDIHTLNEYKSNYIVECSNMSLHNEVLQDKLENISSENCLLAQKLEDMEKVLAEYRSYKSKFEACMAENAELSLSLKQEAFENERLQHEMSLLKEKLVILKAQSEELVYSRENLESTISFVQDKLADMLSSYSKQFCVLVNSDSLSRAGIDIKDATLQLEEILQHLYGKIIHLIKENQNLESERVSTDVSLKNARLQILEMKQKFKSDIQIIKAKLDAPNALADKLQDELESMAKKLLISSEIEENFVQQNNILLSDLTLLEDQIQDLTNRHLNEEIVGLNVLAEELERSRSTIYDLTNDKEKLVLSVKDTTEQSTNLAAEISCLKEDLRILQDEYYKEKACKDELEEKVRDLTSQLKCDQNKLDYIEHQKTELLHVRELASDLELEKSRLAHLLVKQNALIEKLKKENSYHTSLEHQLFEMHEYSLGADVKLVYVSNQYQSLLEELLLQLVYSEDSVKDLQQKYNDLQVLSNHCLTIEAKWVEERAALLTTLESLQSDLEVSGAHNKFLLDSSRYISNELEECKLKLVTMEKDLSLEKEVQASEMERLKNMLLIAEEEIGYLTCSKEELEILIIVFRSKIYEQCTDVTLLKEYENELMMLRSQCNELSHKLSQQVLKTEEFKNLSIHLKELKDEAEAECLVARENKEPDGPPVAAQDSLRVAFIKEQYETQLLELKQQLAVSRKHGEEMLMKLQDAINENENRKRSEAVNMKRNEELAQKLLALEEELQSAITEKREKMIAFDRTKAELECALLSLECCKEEKEKLETSLQEIESEKADLADQLILVKVHMEHWRSSTAIISERSGFATEVESAVNGSTGNSSPLSLEQEEYSFKRGNSMSVMGDENADSNTTEMQNVQDTASNNQVPDTLKTGISPKCDEKNKDVNGTFVGAQDLRSSMEHLHKELEKMKNENTVFDKNHDLDSDIEFPQREILQLNKANDELRSMFPLYNEIPSEGNALERVLALEIELAESLRSNNKLNIQFQSSFLKQHSDEEAVLKSFRDINELIKEILEIKGRYAAVESELREMHERYSQLSLQFAEVEGDRQKLKMTLKNVRASRKLMNRSWSASVADSSP